MTDVRVVLVTAPDGETAADLARKLVDDGLVACVNLVAGVRSIYRWQGRLCDDRETLMVMKSTLSRVEELIARVIELHPYDVPEVLSLPVDAGAADYLNWVRDATQPEGRSR